MTYQVLARKWRPTNFDEVIGQEHVVRSLRNGIINQRLGHAYLFTGTRGVGKTTLARILAKAICCQQRLPDANPCNQCSSCQDINQGPSFDVQEMDGASNNSVEHIRNLVDTVSYLPASGQYKVYIIDEIHMLSVSAFNALLKTLEAPPSHVIFIFATTAPEKLLPTVLSRCQRYDLKNASNRDLAQLLEKISQVEDIRFGSEVVIERLCQVGRGSMRDTLSALEQVRSFASGQVITEEMLVESLGLILSADARQLGQALLGADYPQFFAIFHQLLERNISIQQIVQTILDFLFQEIKARGAHSSADTGLDGAELYWVYETLARECLWTLQSMEPTKVTEVLLQKILLRRTFFASPVAEQIEPEKKKLKI